jgi:hypothetical protein
MGALYGAEITTNSTVNAPPGHRLCDFGAAGYIAFGTGNRAVDTHRQVSPVMASITGDR